MPWRSQIHRPPWQPTRAEAERRRKAVLDARRPGARARGYDAEWDALRARKLAADPWCQHPGCSKRATDVDHILSVRSHPHLRLTWSNLRSFCHPHHSSRTAREQGFARPRS